MSGPTRLVLSALLVVGLAATALFAHQAWRLAAQADARASADAAARSGAAVLLSISHESVDRDLDEVLAVSTGELAEQFRAERDGLREVVTQTKASSAAEVLGSAVVSVEDRSAQVLVAADAVVDNAEQQVPVRQRYRMTLDLRRVGDEWLVEQVSFAGAQP